MGGAIPKQFMSLAGKPILAHTLSALSNPPLVSGIFLVVPGGHIRDTSKLVSEWSRQWAASHSTRSVPEISIIAGGAERRDSVYNGLKALPVECDWVVIHDAVRPFATSRLIEAAWESARTTGACIAAIPATDTVKRVFDGSVRETLPRDEIWMVQTPQVFQREIVVDAYERAITAGWTGTDDASFVERMGVPVSIVRGERTNIKVTTPEDLEWAQWFISRKVGEGRAS
jgi:2-C-methyl-D-erythritol 4-phosphate cytidylyltransferase